MTITRAQARDLCAYAVNDALDPACLGDIPNHENVRYVGWNAGEGPVFVAVWSYLHTSIRLDDDEAEDLAADLLHEVRWFANGRVPADYIL